MRLQGVDHVVDHDNLAGPGPERRLRSDLHLVVFGQRGELVMQRAVRIDVVGEAVLDFRPHQVGIVATWNASEAVGGGGKGEGER